MPVFATTSRGRSIRSTACYSYADIDEHLRRLWRRLATTPATSSSRGTCRGRGQCSSSSPQGTNGVQRRLQQLRADGWHGVDAWPEERRPWRPDGDRGRFRRSCRLLARVQPPRLERLHRPLQLQSGHHDHGRTAKRDRATWARFRCCSAIKAVLALRRSPTRPSTR